MKTTHKLYESNIYSLVQEMVSENIIDFFYDETPRYKKYHQQSYVLFVSGTQECMRIIFDQEQYDFFLDFFKHKDDLRNNKAPDKEFDLTQYVNPDNEEALFDHIFFTVEKWSHKAKTAVETQDICPVLETVRKTAQELVDLEENDPQGLLQLNAELLHSDEDEPLF